MEKPAYGINPLVEAIEPSTIRALNALKKPTSIDLGLGEPTLAPHIEHLEAATRWIATHGCRYTPNPGDPELRGLIAKHYRFPGFERTENVVVTAGGSQEAVYLAIKALLDPGKDALLVAEPAFPVYAKCAQMEGVAVQRVAMRAIDGFAFDAERILAALTPQTRMIVICSPCNPTARVISRAQAQVLANGLAARGGAPVYVLHDEVYRELTFVRDAGWFAELYPHTVVVNSLSKSNALTGIRLGWIVAPAAVVPALAQAHALLVSTASTFAQRVAIEIFRTPGGLAQDNRWYAEQRGAALDALAALRLEHVPVEGTFYVAVRIGEGANSLEFAHRLAQQDDVIAIPGSTFGDSFEGWLRCSWVAPVEALRAGFGRIATALAAAR